MCYNCRNQTLRGFRAMSTIINRKDYGDYLQIEDYKLIDSLAQIKDYSQKSLRKLQHENFDLGESVVSILISRFRDTDADPRKSLEITNNLLKAGLAAYLAADCVITKYQPDLVYLFNGRGSQQRAILRACEKHQVTYDVIEEGCDLNHYALFRNSTPHDISYRTKMIRELWQLSDRNKMLDLSISFYEKRANSFKGYGVMQSFTHAQEKGRLPDHWNSDAHNVVVFCSSEDEFAAIGEQWKNQLYGSQLNGLKQISRSSINYNSSICIYLRMHPNLSGLHNKFRSECELLSHSRFVVIPPESSISSYALMFAADTVVSFASTIGIEATYWGKPSVLLGSCFYQELDVAYKPQTHEECMNLLTMKLTPKDREGALMYGCYMMSFGKPYIMSKVGNSPTDVRFRGVHLRGGFMMRFLLAIRERFTGRTIDRLIKRGMSSKIE